jgi:hypothetical protein
VHKNRIQGGVAQVIECLPSKGKTLISNISTTTTTTKENKKPQKKMQEHTQLFSAIM